MDERPTPETDALWSAWASETLPNGQFRYGPQDLADLARKLERELDEKTLLAMQFSGELSELRTAIRNLRDAKGRHNTQLAAERIFALLPENIR